MRSCARWAADTPGTLLLRFLGTSHNDRLLVFGQRGGVEGSWHPIVWAMHGTEQDLIDTIATHLTGKPLLVLGLVWAHSPDGNDCLRQIGMVSLTRLPSTPAQPGMLDLFAGVGTWAAAGVRLGVPQLGMPRQ